MISTALVHSGMDWQYKISSTVARKVVTSWFLHHWSTPKWTGNRKSVQHLLARWCTPHFYSIGPLRSGLAIQNQVNICSIDGAHHILQHWSTPEWTGNTKSVQHLLVRWWCHYFHSNGPLRSGLAIQNQFNICSLDGAHHYLFSLVRYIQIDLMFYVHQVSSNGLPTEYEWEKWWRTWIQNYRRLQNTYGITLLTSKI